MRKIFTFFLLLTVTITALSQTIKFKMPAVTSSTGEEILAFEVSDTVQATSFGGTGGTALPKFEFVKIKKLKGPSTNELFKRSFLGTHATEATFEFYDTGGVLYYKIVIKDVTINHFSFLSPECSGCNQIIHQVWFDYDIIEATDIATGNIVKYSRSAKQ